jgi:hypothetical protein
MDWRFGDCCCCCLLKKAFFDWSRNDLFWYFFWKTKLQSKKKTLWVFFCTHLKLCFFSFQRERRTTGYHLLTCGGAQESPAGPLRGGLVRPPRRGQMSSRRPTGTEFCTKFGSLQKVWRKVYGVVCSIFLWLVSFWNKNKKSDRFPSASEGIFRMIQTAAKALGNVWKKCMNA